MRVILLAERNGGEKYHRQFFSVRADNGLLHKKSERREENRQQEYVNRRKSATTMALIFLMPIATLVSTGIPFSYEDVFASGRHDHRLHFGSEVQSNNNIDRHDSGRGGSVSSRLLCNGLHLGAGLFGGPIAGFLAAVIIPCPGS